MSAGHRLHEAAKANKVKALEKLLDEGYSVDIVIGGFTALYLSVEAGNIESVQFLLARKANPNARCISGMTSLHIACRQGYLPILEMLVQCGGDLRLRDDEGRTPYEYARDCQDTQMKLKLLNFISVKRSEAYRFSDGHSKSKIPTADGISQLKRRLSSGHQRKKWCSEKLITDGGFGSVYQLHSSVGVPTHIQHLSSGLLFLSDNSQTLWAGPMSVYQTMYWGNLKVTVKRSTINSRISKGFRSDIILQEIDNIRKLSVHPYYLWPLAISPTQDMEDAYIVYEAVHLGNLYDILHDDDTITLSTGNMLIILHQICEAMLYLHSSGFVHGCLNPHVVAVISPTQGKLGGLEYLSSQTKSAETHKFSLNDTAIQEYYFHWLAPEVLAGNAPTAISDVYGMCILIWEVFHGVIPWLEEDLAGAHKLVVEEKKTLPILDQMPEPLDAVIQMGLMASSADRCTDLEAIYEALASVLVSHDAKNDGLPFTWNRRVSLDYNRRKLSDKSFMTRSSFRTPPPYQRDSSFDESEAASQAGDEVMEMSSYATVQLQQTPAKKALTSTPKSHNRPTSVSSDGGSSAVSVNLEKATTLLKDRLSKLVVTNKFNNENKHPEMGMKPAGIKSCISPIIRQQPHFFAQKTTPLKQLSAKEKFSHIPGSPTKVEKSLRFESCLEEPNEPIYAKVTNKNVPSAGAAPPAPPRKLDEVDGPSTQSSNNSNNNNNCSPNVIFHQEFESDGHKYVEQMNVEPNHTYKCEVISVANPMPQHILRLTKTNRATGEVEVHEEYGTSCHVRFEMP